MDRHADSPYLKRAVLCQTGEGRDFPLLWLRDDAVTDPRRLCVIVARQHAGEVPGSYVLEGILEGVLEETEAGSWCRKNLVFLVVPFVDLDGVAEGRYGKDRPPRDFNRDWCSKPVHPEIRALLPAIDEAARRWPYALFLDLHAPAPHDVSFWLPSRLSYGTPQWDESWKLGQLIEEHVPEECPVRVEDYPFSALNWSQEMYEQTATYYQPFRYGVLSATMEISYHRHAGGGYVTPEGWRGLGKGVVSALSRHLQEEATPPAPQRAAWGMPPPVLRDWTLPALPQGVRLEPVSPTHIMFHPEGPENLSWVTCNRFVTEKELTDGEVFLRYEGGGSNGGSVEVIVYFYSEGQPTGERKHFYAGPGTRVMGWDGTLLPPGSNAARFSIRVRHISARLGISIVVR
jgi:hypothetical protein